VGGAPTDFVEGTIDSVDQNGFTIRFGPDLTQEPDRTTPDFRITRSSSLQDQLLAGLGLGGQGGFSFTIPTLQDLVEELADRTGIDFLKQVQITGGLSDLVIQIPLVLDPKPITFQQHLELGDKIGGLTLVASGDFDVTIDPRFQITLGLNLAPNVPLEQRFFIVDNTNPNVHDLTLSVTAQPNDPNVHGSIGFLNVDLTENRAANAPPDNPATPNDEHGNKGVVISFTATVDLNDPASGTLDGLITLDEISSHLLQTFRFGVSGFLDIDGLKLSASLGNATQLGFLTIALDAESSAAAPGHIGSLADFGKLLAHFAHHAT
jgi:hypothetical protein